MRIMVDINHPANVHYFKHFIHEMQSRGHEILVTASDKEVSYRLLDAYGIPYVKLGSYGTGLIKKMINIPILDWRMLRIAHSFRPDVLIGHGSIRAAHASAILGVPCIATDDTEHAKFEHLLYLPFTDYVLTPSCFQKGMGRKKIPFPGFMELLYLHPNRFQPDPSILQELGLEEGERYIVVRFVSWEASHDIGQSGVTDRVRLVRELQKEGKVFISSESDLPKELENLRLRIPPERLHDLLYYATLYVGEGATTASECAMLGTHALYINSLKLGYIDELENKYGIVSSFSNGESFSEISEFIIKLLSDPDLKRSSRQKRDRIINEKVDPTSFLVDFVQKVIK